MWYFEPNPHLISGLASAWSEWRAQAAAVGLLLWFMWDVKEPRIYLTYLFLFLLFFLARINQPVAQTSSSCSSESAVLSCQDVFVGVLKQVAMGKAIRQEAMLPTCSSSLLCASGIFSDWMAGQGVFTQWLTQTQLFSSERGGWGN